MAVLDGVKVGPLDPDKGEMFGQVAGGNTARQLMRMHTQMFPAQLRQALALKIDEARTRALDIDEVRDYLDDLELDNGDPAVPKDSEIVGAAVRGERDRPQVLIYTYRLPSGRTAKWFAPYGQEELPQSFADGSERVHLAEMKERGVVMAGPTRAGVDEVALARENRELKKRLDDLRGELEGVSRQLAEREAQSPPEAPEAAGEQDGEEEPAAGQEPPFEGYDDVKAPDLAKRIKADEFDSEELEAIVAYERSHANRKGVVTPAEQKLDAPGD